LAQVVQVVVVTHPDLLVEILYFLQLPLMVVVLVLLPEAQQVEAVVPAAADQMAVLLALETLQLLPHRKVITVGLALQMEVEVAVVLLQQELLPLQTMQATAVTEPHLLSLVLQ
jgi:hypothetical protein